MAFDPETYERLMLKQLDEQATPEEVDALAGWLAASPDHQLQYEQLKSVWELTSGPPAIPPPNRANAWKNVATKARLRSAADRPAQPTPHRQVRTRQWNRAWLALPVLLVGAAVLWILSTRTPSVVEIVSLPGDIQSVMLPDSTLIRLHGGSSVRYAAGYNGDHRQVDLDGEAYFDVTSSSLPFQVFSNDAQVQVLGTQFSVRTQETSTEVVVAEGRVRVMHQQGSAAPVELGPGQGVRVANNEINQLDSGTLRNTEAWIAGAVTFDATPLPEAIDQLSRIWNTPITITAPGLEAQTVSGSIRLEGVQQTLETLCLTSGSACQVRNEGDSYFIF